MITLCVFFTLLWEFVQFSRFSIPDTGRINVPTTYGVFFITFLSPILCIRYYSAQKMFFLKHLSSQWA